MKDSYDSQAGLVTNGIYIIAGVPQLYKHNWCNQNQGGVHFETYIEAREIKQKQFPICMHAEKTALTQRFIEEFLALEEVESVHGKAIKRWQGLCDLSAHVASI